jgi:hypothetical protein
VPGSWLQVRGYSARFSGVSGMATAEPSNMWTRRPSQGHFGSTRSSSRRPTRRAVTAKNRSGRRRRDWQ